MKTLLCIFFSQCELCVGFILLMCDRDTCFHSRNIIEYIYVHFRTSEKAAEGCASKIRNQVIIIINITINYNLYTITIINRLI